MKKTLMAIIVMAGFSVMAQDHNMKGKRNTMNDLTPEQVATLQTKRMTLALDLNDAQQAKMISILTADAKSHKTKMETFKARKEKGEKMTAEEKYSIQNERLDHKIARKKEMKSLLSAEQYVKWEKMKQRKRGRHHEKMEGHRKDMDPKRG